MYVSVSHVMCVLHLVCSAVAQSLSDVHDNVTGGGCTSLPQLHPLAFHVLHAPLLMYFRLYKLPIEVCLKNTAHPVNLFPPQDSFCVRCVHISGEREGRANDLHKAPTHPKSSEN